MSIIRLKNLLKSGPSGELGQLARRAEGMGELGMRLRAGIDGTLAPHLLAANLRENGDLVVIASSSAWAARLRFESETLLRLARATGVAVHSCRVIVSQDLRSATSPSASDE